MLRELAYGTRTRNVDCTCGKRTQHEIIDARTRLAAIQTWADYTFGKPAQAPPTNNNPTATLADLATLDEQALAALARTGE